MRAREAAVGGRVYGEERAALYGTAPIAVAPDVGELLYLLAYGRRARTIVEFGASLGVSTIYLASAISDHGVGSVITTEVRPEKARLARASLTEAGLDGVVELREGDARVTLRDLAGEVELLFLDGWNDLYLPILGRVEPRLAPGALVAADMSRDDPHLDAYRDHVGDPDSGYRSIEVPLDEGVVLSA